jgi:undecaprenyl-diphosphatase
VGVSRIWVGVHYPFDVFAGVLISLAAATFIYLTFPKLSVTQTTIKIYEKCENRLLLLFKRTKGNKSKNF